MKRNIIIFSAFVALLFITYQTGMQFSKNNSSEIQTISPEYKSEAISQLATQLEKTNRALVSMQDQIDRLNQRIEKASISENNPKASDINEDLSPEEYAQLADEQFRSYVQSEINTYDAESTDLHWSDRAETQLETGLETYEDKFQFTMVSSTCKTTRCKTVVSFDSYELAEEYGTRLAEVAIPGMNCAQAIYLPEPNYISARYEANLLLDCTEQIQGRVQPN